MKKFPHHLQVGARRASTQLIQPHSRTMKKTLLAIIGLVAVSLAGVNGQVFTGNYTFGTGGNVTSFNYNGAAITDLTVSALTKNGVTTSSNSGNFRATAWPLDPSVPNMTGAIDTAKYFEFTLTTSLGFTVNMTSITFGLGRSGTGPRTFEWRSSVDSFASTINNYGTLSANVTNASGVLTLPDTSSTTETGNVLSLSSASFKNLSSVTFRFYAFNSEASGTGSAGFQGPLFFAGEVVPEPSTWALIGLGSAFVLWRIRRRRVVG
jgi:hypothetical protein